MTGTATHPNDPVATVLGSLPSREHQQAFQSVLTAILADQPPGICITGERGIGRANFLRGLAAVLPADRVRLLWLDAASSPDDLARCVAEAESHRANGAHRVLLIVSGADALRRDTLYKLDELAGTLRSRPPGLQMLLCGEPTLLTRLTITKRLNLQLYLTKRLTLALLSPTEAEEYLLGHVSAMQPQVTLTDQQRAAILGTATGNPSLIRRALSHPLPAMAELPHADDGMQAALWGRGAVLALLAVLVVGTAGFALTFHSQHGRLGGTQPSAGPIAPPLSGSLPGRTADSGPPPDPTPAPVAQPPALADARPHGPVPDAGLIIVARSGDSLAQLYRRIYAGLEPPSFDDVVAANPRPIRPGARVMFPRPPRGWEQGAAPSSDGGPRQGSSVSQ